MLPITHPDATAFAARFLADPADRLGRLVFADWLEEQGGEANEMWARYLRYMAHAEDDFDGVFRQRADSLGRVVRARLTLTGVPGISLLPWLTSFLPAHRVWVRIGEERIPQSVVEVCPESVARRCVAVPIGHDDRRIHLVTAVPGYLWDYTLETLRVIFPRQVVLLRGESNDVRRAINAHYWASAITVTS